MPLLAGPVKPLSLTRNSHGADTRSRRGGSMAQGKYAPHKADWRVCGACFCNAW